MQVHLTILSENPPEVGSVIQHEDLAIEVTWQEPIEDIYRVTKDGKLVNHRPMKGWPILGTTVYKLDAFCEQCGDHIPYLVKDVYQDGDLGHYYCSQKCWVEDE